MDAFQFQLQLQFQSSNSLVSCIERGVGLLAPFQTVWKKDGCLGSSIWKLNFSGSIGSLEFQLHGHDRPFHHRRKRVNELLRPRQPNFCESNLRFSFRVWFVSFSPPLPFGGFAPSAWPGDAAILNAFLALVLVLAGCKTCKPLSRRTG